MTSKEAITILGITSTADIQAVKQAYRKLAFSLHPDLNPDLPDASKKFQKLNEAYVLLSSEFITVEPHHRSKSKASTAASTKAREEAKKAYKKAATEQKNNATRQSTGTSSASNEESEKEEVLHTILNDPFARRVFEDIYSFANKSGKKNHAVQEEPTKDVGSDNGAAKKKTKEETSADFSSIRPQVSGGVLGKMKNWLRSQIDDEQTLRLPGDSLIPGARVQLQIQHGLSGESQTIELTLPPSFVPGKVMRVKGMGKRLGKIAGDLYVKIVPI